MIETLLKLVLNSWITYNDYEWWYWCVKSWTATV